MMKIKRNLLRVIFCLFFFIMICFVFSCDAKLPLDKNNIGINLSGSSFNFDYDSCAVNGVIGDETHDISGYCEVSYSTEDNQTCIIVADTYQDYLDCANVWCIVFTGQSTGTFTAVPDRVNFYVSVSDFYWTLNDFSLTVTEYSDAKLSGSFSGTIDYFPNYSLGGSFEPESTETFTGSFCLVK